jgi:hypothetical protein
VNHLLFSPMQPWRRQANIKHQHLECHLLFSPLQPWRRQANIKHQHLECHLPSSVHPQRLKSHQPEGCRQASCRWTRHPVRRKSSLQPEDLQLVRRKLSRAVDYRRQCLLHLPLVRRSVHRFLLKVTAQLQGCPLSAKQLLEDTSSLVREFE